VISHFAQTNYNSLGSLKTVSLSVGTPEFDETSFAIDSSRLTGTSHYSFKFDPDPNVLSEYLNKFADIPFADSSVILMYQLTKFMSENNLIVGLTGDGGDELFGGYSKYNLFLTYAKLKPFIKLGHIAIPYLGQKNIAQNNNKFRKYFETSPTLS
jgi:asparagine synthase (glutamine-hydrolysing)